jgi:hypothetical protein
MNGLKQRKFVDVKEFMFREKGVKVAERQFGRLYEYMVPYESITTNVERLTSASNRLLLFIGGVFTVSVVLYEWLNGDIWTGIIWLILGSLAFLYYLRNTWDFVVVNCKESSLTFFPDKPNKAVFESFLQQVFERRNEYLKTRYAVVDPDYSTEENAQRFEWLKDNGVITNEEYENLLNLIGIKSKEFHGIGF